MRRALPAFQILVLVSLLSACNSPRGSQLAPISAQDPRYGALATCAQTIGIGEGFQVSSSTGTLLERQVSDMRAQVKELLWLGSQVVGDSVRASAHVQLTSSGARRTTFDQLSPVAQRVVQRINTECVVARGGAHESR